LSERLGKSFKNITTQEKINNALVSRLLVVKASCANNRKIRLHRLLGFTLLAEALFLNRLVDA
jgi:hypothetical protein